VGADDTQAGALLGRGDELARLHEIAAAARSRRGGAITLVGAPGVGKTALLSAVAPTGIRAIDLTAAESEVTFSSASAWAWKSRSKPSGREAPSMNQSRVCATWATCWAAVIMPACGRKPESPSSRTLVDRSKNSWLASNWWAKL